MTVFTAKQKETPVAKKAYDTTVCLDQSTTLNKDGTDAVNSLKRHRALTSCCLLLLIIWLLIASFLAGIFFYRQFYKRPTFYGWCGTDLMQRGRNERLEQSLEINPDELYERISVPRFGFNRPAIYVHDFKKNLTAIVDVVSDRCFLKDLDRNLVAPPTSLIDLVEKMEAGYYEHRPAVIRETYRVARKMKESEVYRLHSLMINRHCARRSMFLLQKAASSRDSPYFVRDKRHLHKGRPTSLQFSVMSGSAVEVDQIIF